MTLCDETKRLSHDGGDQCFQTSQFEIEEAYITGIERYTHGGSRNAHDMA